MHDEACTWVSTWDEGGMEEGAKVRRIVYCLMSLVHYVKTSGCVGIIHAYIAYSPSDIHVQKCISANMTLVVSVAHLPDVVEVSMRNQLLGLQFLVLIEHLVEVEPRLKVAEPAERE